MAAYKIHRTGANVEELLNRVDNRTLFHYNTTAYWDAATGYIPKAGEIIIYSDYKTIEVNGQTVNVAGVKIGSGNGYVQDLAFLNENDSQALLTHLSDTSVHIQAGERSYWNNKLNVTDSEEVVNDTLIFNRN